MGLLSPHEDMVSLQVSPPRKWKGKAFMQLAKTISKLEKALKKSSRASSKKKKSHYDSDSCTDSE
jgi:hypothetical protein